MSDEAPMPPCSIDTTLLATATTDHIPYTPEDSTLTFRNDMGEEKVFRMQYYTESASRQSLEGVLCADGQHATRFTDLRNAWYESPDSLGIFINHYIRFRVNQPWTYQRFAEADPYEMFLIAMQPLVPEGEDASLNSCVMRRLVNDFGSFAVQLEKSQFEDVQFFSTVQVADTNLSDVYLPDDCQGEAPTFYYRPEDGIVAFVDTAGVAWFAR